ncbi:hypothetical protein HY493_00720 [Candidatus Woesearchaeota archaeon]|nr:hypothetical protein [Candidatus Woesearchaeota archaeon]
MVDSTLVLAAGLASIALQVVAVYYVIAIYRYNRLAYAWLALAVASAIMVVRRVTALGKIEAVFPAAAETLRLLDTIILPLTISVCLVIGYYSMKRRFETFEIVEKTTSEKAAKMVLTRSKRRKA